MITIKTRPYDGITPKLNSVYNGLPFVLDSNSKQKPNFRYLCDIWCNDAKVSSLRHSPDISADNFGIFDIGPILESYLSYDQKALSPFSAIAGDQTVKKYWAEFGEEYARTNSIAAITTYYSGYVRIQTKYPHSLRQGDAVYIQGCSNAAYNGWKRLSTSFAVGQNYFIIMQPWAGSSDVSSAWMSEAEIVTAWSATTISGQQYLTVTCLDKNSAKSRFNLGETVQVNWHTYAPQTDVPQNSYENTDWKIISVRRFNTGLVSAIVKYVLDCPYKGPVAYQGAITSKDNYVFKNLISTKLEAAYAWNGVLQYDEVNNWNPSKYRFAGTTSSFLTSRPSKSVKVCQNEHWTLHCLGSALNPAGTSLELKVYGTASALIATYNLPMSLTSNVVPIGPKNLKDASISQFVSGEAKSYSLMATNGGQTSEQWTFTIDCECERLKAYKLMWLNKEGGFDYYKFPNRADKSLAIEKSTYDKNMRYVGPTKYGYEYGDRGRTTYGISSRQTIVVRSGFLTQAELDWIGNIYESPEVYWIDEDSAKIYPATIMNTAVEQPNKQNRGDAGSLYIYSIELEMAYQRNTQRGGIGAPDRAAGNIDNSSGNNSWY